MLPVVAVCVLLAQTPQPFPKPGATRPPAPGAPAPQTPPAKVQPPGQPAPGPNDIPTEASLGVPIYPAAEFVGSFDAGRGQRYYLFGTNTGISHPEARQPAGALQDDHPDRPFVAGVIASPQAASAVTWRGPRGP